LRANKGGTGQVKRLCDVFDVMVNAGDERGFGHSQAVPSVVLLGVVAQAGGAVVSPPGILPPHSGSVRQRALPNFPAMGPR